MKIKRALISVSNKTSILDFCRELSNLEIELIATQGTFTFLQEGGVTHLKLVAEVTNFPEILNGIVKTEHPIIIGGILAKKEKKEHMKELKLLGIQPIDMVVCNFSLFDPSIDEKEKIEKCVERIDIGGPNLIRAAAKNYQNVIVIVNPNRYDQVLHDLKEKGDVTLKTRGLLAAEAFKVIAQYDLAISHLFETIG